MALFDVNFELRNGTTLTSGHRIKEQTIDYAVSKLHAALRHKWLLVNYNATYKQNVRSDEIVSFYLSLATVPGEKDPLGGDNPSSQPLPDNAEPNPFFFPEG